MSKTERNLISLFKHNEGKINWNFVTRLHNIPESFKREFKDKLHL